MRVRDRRGLKGRCHRQEDSIQRQHQPKQIADIAEIGKTKAKNKGAAFRSALSVLIHVNQ